MNSLNTVILLRLFVLTSLPLFASSWLSWVKVDYDPAEVSEDPALTMAQYCGRRCQNRQLVVTKNRCTIPQCFPCDCSTHCSKKGTCCPTVKLDQGVERGTFKHGDEEEMENYFHRIHSRLKCRDTHAGNILMVASCPENWTDDYERLVDVTEKCENRTAETFESITPYTEKWSGLTFANIFCAECNGFVPGDGKLEGNSDGEVDPVDPGLEGARDGTNLETTPETESVPSEPTGSANEEGTSTSGGKDAPSLPVTPEPTTTLEPGWTEGRGNTDIMETTSETNIGNANEEGIGASSGKDAPFITGSSTPFTTPNRGVSFSTTTSDGGRDRLGSTTIYPLEPTTHKIEGTTIVNPNITWYKESSPSSVYTLTPPEGYMQSTDPVTGYGLPTLPGDGGYEYSTTYVPAADQNLTTEDGGTTYTHLTPETSPTSPMDRTKSPMDRTNQPTSHPHTPSTENPESNTRTTLGSGPVVGRAATLSPENGKDYVDVTTPSQKSLDHSNQSPTIIPQTTWSYHTTDPNSNTDTATDTGSSLSTESGNHSSDSDQEPEGQTDPDPGASIRRKRSKPNFNPGDRPGTGASRDTGSALGGSSSTGTLGSKGGSIPGTEGSRDASIPGTEGSRDGSIPGTEGSRDASIPGTEGSRDGSIPGTEGSKGGSIPGTEGSRDGSIPGTEGSKGGSIPGTEGSRDGSIPGTEGSKGGSIPGTEGSRDGSIPGTEGSKGGSIPGTEGSRDGSIPGTEGSKGGSIPGTEGSRDGSIPGTEGSKGGSIPGTEGSRDGSIPGTEGSRDGPDARTGKNMPLPGGSVDTHNPDVGSNNENANVLPVLGFKVRYSIEHKTPHHKVTLRRVPLLVRCDHYQNLFHFKDAFQFFKKAQELEECVVKFPEPDLDTSQKDFSVTKCPSGFVEPKTVSMTPKCHNKAKDVYKNQCHDLPLRQGLVVSNFKNIFCNLCSKKNLNALVNAKCEETASPTFLPFSMIDLQVEDASIRTARLSMGCQQNGCKNETRLCPPGKILDTNQFDHVCRQAIRKYGGLTYTLHARLLAGFAIQEDQDTYLRIVDAINRTLIFQEFKVDIKFFSCEDDVVEVDITGLITAPAGLERDTFEAVIVTRLSDILVMNDPAGANNTIGIGEHPRLELLCLGKELCGLYRHKSWKLMRCSPLKMWSNTASDQVSTNNDTVLLLDVTGTMSCPATSIVLINEVDLNHGQMNLTFSIDADPFNTLWNSRISLIRGEWKLCPNVIEKMKLDKMLGLYQHKGDNDYFKGTGFFPNSDNNNITRVENVTGYKHKPMGIAGDPINNSNALLVERRHSVVLAGASVSTVYMVVAYALS